MPVVTSHAQGTPSFVDLSTTDPEAAQAFYSGLFGWSFETNPTGDGGEYHMASLEGSTTAGMMQQVPEQAEMGLPSLWSTYFTVDDLEATIAKVEADGGSIHMPPMQVMDAGHMAVIADPTGAVCCLWQPNQNIGSERVNEHGALIWNELASSDPARSMQFYADVFGAGTMEQDMGQPEPYRMLVVGENPVAGIMAHQMEGVPDAWTVYFAVDDIEVSMAKVAELGGTVVLPRFDVPGVGKMAGISDPTGAMCMIMEPEPQE